MEFSNDSSMLSDELKPRRTPVPSSFGDLIPRPSVPDLSIIETPQTSAPRIVAASVAQSQTSIPRHVAAAAAQAQPALNHLSYNDWRLKTGGASLNDPPNSSSGSRRSMEAIQPVLKSPSYQVPVTMTHNGHPQDSIAYRKERVEERMYSRPNQPSGKVVSYMDLKHRPTSAPSVRPHQPEGSAGREHSMSNSAPPMRSSNQNPYQSQGPGRLNHHTPAADPHNFTQQYQQNVAPAPQSNVNRYSSPPVVRDELSLVPSSDLNSQQANMRRQVENPSSRRKSSGQSRPGPAHFSEDPMRDRDQFVYNEVPFSHHMAPSLGGGNMYVCPSGCYHPPRKNVGSWPYGDQFCCPSASSVVPHSTANTIHPVPASTMQHVAAHPQVSYDDLYKIVLAQNDQLKALQAQVERLLVTKDQKAITKTCCDFKETDKLPVAVCSSKAVSEEGTQTSDCESRDDDCQKMSIGVMTSFIHAVTYRGRVERLDAVHNVSEHEGMSSNGNLSKQSKSTSSDDYSSSSLSPASKSSAPLKNSSGSNCCKDCSSQERHNERSKNRPNKKDKSKPIPHDSHKNMENGNAGCAEGCNCNNPGVSAAITAVRGCQAVLASQAGMTAHDYSTFNGADLPTVTEQPVSPMSSIHVDLHDYRSSSSDEESGSSDSDEDDTSEEGQNNPKDQEPGSKPNGWTFYNNVLGQVNKILEDRDMAGQNPSANQVMAVQPHKQTDTSVSKRVAFEATGMKDTPQNLKEMAIKYLRENHPEELVTTVTTKKSKKAQRDKLQEMAVYNMPASNMSFATFRYLERYNLLPENFNPEQYLEATTNVHGYNPNAQEPQHSPMLNRGSKKLSRIQSGKSKTKSSVPSAPSNGGHYQLQPLSNGKAKACNPPPVYHDSPRKRTQLNTPTSKILDITTLRQQPKLL